MKVNKYVTVNAGVQLIYDDNILLPFEKKGGKKTNFASKTDIKGWAYL